MNYQRIVCLGDSQTFGARTYCCYPMHLVRELNLNTDYVWTVANHSANGRTARDLWFALACDLPAIKDTYTACLLIGTNDVGNQTPVESFGEYYRQILDTLAISGIKTILCGEIPPIWADGHAFFSREAAASLSTYNDIVKTAVAACPRAGLVNLSHLTRDHYVDPVHFSESGNRAVAAAFSAAIREY